MFILLHTFGSIWVYAQCMGLDLRADSIFRSTLGPSIYNVHKKSDFLPPPSVHMHPHEPDPLPLCGRPRAVDMKYTSLS